MKDNERTISSELRQGIKNNLRTYRKKQGFKQEQIAGFINVDRTTYSKWENKNERYLPSIVDIIQLSRLYNITVDALLKFNDEFSLAASSIDNVYGDDYLSELTNEERHLIGNYRMLRRSDKTSVDEFIKSIITE